MQFNTALWTALLGDTDLASAINGGFLYYYSGPVPTDLDAAVDASCVKLLKVSLDGGSTGLTLTTPDLGAMAKPTADTWSGTALATGTPTFFRWCLGADDGSLSSVAGAYRMQGSAGLATGDPDTTPESSFSSVPFTGGKLVTIDTLTITKP